MPRASTSKQPPIPAEVPQPEDDTAEAIKSIHEQLQRLRDVPRGPTMVEIESKFGRAQKWGGFLSFVGGLVSFIFVAGITFAVTRDKIATDEEVRDAVRVASIAHNGVDPEQRDSEGRAIGHHPDLVRHDAEHSQTLAGIQATLQQLATTQRRIDRRSEYLIEYVRWQTTVMEADRKRSPGKAPAKLPEKSARLQELERGFFLGD